LERQKMDGSKEPTLEQLVTQVEREEKAVRSVTAFARALAGTDELPAPPSPAVEVHGAEPAPQAPEPAKRTGSRRRCWPDHDEVLTWDEAMRFGWHDPLAQENARMMRRLSDDAATSRDPWANWGAIGPPSYARTGDDDKSES
jgi:hypothetical protein